jgi:predicted PurR-regulated permease PerM
MKGNLNPLEKGKNGEDSSLFRALAIVVIVILVFATLKAMRSVMIPIVFAFFVVLILNPLLRKLDKLHVPFALSTFIGIMLFIAFLVAAGWLMVATTQGLISGIPPYANRIAAFDVMLTNKLSAYLYFPQGETILSKLDVNWMNVVLTSLTNISGQFATIISNVLLIIVFTLFILLERRTFIPKIIDAVSHDQSNMVKSISERITKQMSRYLLIKVTISSVTGILFYVTAKVVGMDFAVLWGIMALVLNFIPTIGSLISTIAIIAMSVLQFAPSWVPIIYVTVLAISIQTVLGNILDPRLQGIQLGLSPLILLISLSLWGYIWGLAGMFLAVPLTSGLQVVCINIPFLRPVAIILGGGKTYVRRKKEEDSLRKSIRKVKGVNKRASKEDLEKQADARAKEAFNRNDFVFPENFPGDKK